MKTDLVWLLNGAGETVAQWTAGEFPDWLATYLNTQPNENAMWTYRIRHNDEHHNVHPGPLAVEVYRVLLELGLASGPAAIAEPTNTAAAPTDEQLAAIAYRAYSHLVGYRSVHGERLPVWDGLGGKVAAGWTAAAAAVAAAVRP